MKAEIISVGTELLTGYQIDSNSKYLSAQLKCIGIETYRHIAVNDDMREIESSLADALGRSNIVILTGGLGPTEDDITKDAVCKLLGIDMHIDEPSLNKIESYFFRKGEKMADNNIKQAMLPDGAVPVKNELGLAVGAILKSGNQCIIILPGPPHELQAMFEKSVRPILKEMTGNNVVSKTVNVFGMSESLIAEALKDIIDKKSPEVATYANIGQINVVVTARADDIKEAIKEVDITVDEIERRLGDFVYGNDEPTMNHAVVSELVSRGLKIATAESCTGGLISKKITDIPGASFCFELGIVSYSDNIKNDVLGVQKETLSEYTAVSAETACQMAVGAMTKGKADIGVSVTGYAGPSSSFGEPVGLVFIAVCNKDTVWVKKFDFSVSGKGNRDIIRELASLNAFDMVRRVVNGMAIFNSQRMPISEIANSDQKKETLNNKVIYNSVPEEKDAKFEPKFEKGFKGTMKKIVWKLFPNKQDETSEKVRKSVFLTSCVALIVCLAYIISFFAGISSNNRMYNKLEKLKGQKPSAEITYPTEYLSEFGALYEKNKDIAGWINIDGTDLSYPVVKGKDNDFYLNHNFYGKKNRHGVPFMDALNDVENLNPNTVLYGHNMKSDNQMFSELENYYKGEEALSYYRNHPLISFDTVYEKMNWKIFAVYATNTNPSKGDVFAYNNTLVESDNEAIRDFIKTVRKKSIFNIPVDVEAGDKILTLSTCYYGTEGDRLIVMARKVRKNEELDVDVNSASYNRGGSDTPSFNTESEITSSKETSSFRPASKYEPTSSIRVPIYTSTPSFSVTSSEVSSESTVSSEASSSEASSSIASSTVTSSKVVSNASTPESTSSKETAGPNESKETPPTVKE